MTGHATESRTAVSALMSMIIVNTIVPHTLSQRKHNSTPHASADPRHTEPRT